MKPLFSYFNAFLLKNYWLKQKFVRTFDYFTLKKWIKNSDMDIKLFKLLEKSLLKRSLDRVAKWKPRFSYILNIFNGTFLKIRKKIDLKYSASSLFFTTEISKLVRSVETHCILDSFWATIQKFMSVSAELHVIQLLL